MSFPKVTPSKKPIYLDYAATTPLHPEVKKAMEPYWQKQFGNPSSLYRQGREAKNALDKARIGIAKIINSKPEEIIFTAGGTESINLAIFGVAQAHAHLKPHFITTAVEHHAVLRSFQALEQWGYEVTYLPVDGEGFVKVQEVAAAIRPETVLVSVMYANNEIGTIEPIVEIGKLLKQVNFDRTKNNLKPIYFHTDACQAAGFLNLDVSALGVDLMTINGSKIYGPKQTGCLYIRSGTKLAPFIHGGGQEKNLRSGTENVPGIVGLAKALELAEKSRSKESRRLKKLSEYFFKQLQRTIPNILLNGPKIGEQRLPNNTNLSIEGTEGEALMLYLDSYNIACSTGSACSSVETDPSHVLLAIGRGREQAESSLRFTLGKFTTKQELNYVLKILPGVIQELRKVTTQK